MKSIWSLVLAAGAVLCVAAVILNSIPAGIEQADLTLRIADGEGEIIRRAVLEAPEYIWLGEQADVRLTVLPDETGPSNPVLLETSLALAGADPVEVKREALVNGQSASFRWVVTGQEPGPAQAKLWVWVDAGAGRTAVLARPVEWGVRSWGGFQPKVIRWAGGGGLLICLLLLLSERKRAG